METCVTTMCRCCTLHYALHLFRDVFYPTIVILDCHILIFKFIRKNSKVTQYRGYLDFVHKVGETCGFQVEEDSLRIPSTKRVNTVFIICTVSF